MAKKKKSSASARRRGRTPGKAAPKSRFADIMKFGSFAEWRKSGKKAASKKKAASIKQRAAPKGREKRPVQHKKQAAGKAWNIFGIGRRAKPAPAKAKPEASKPKAAPVKKTAAPAAKGKSGAPSGVKKKSPFAFLFGRKQSEKMRPVPRNLPTEIVKELIASDIMTNKVVSIRDDDALSYVVRLYVDKNISGSPVLTRNGNLVGTLSETDIAQYVGAKDLIDVQANRLDALKETSVSEIMKRNIITVREHTPIHEINYLMNKHDIARVFVTDEKRQVIGIVTRADMVKGISKEMLTRIVEKEREIEKTHVDTGVDQVLETVDNKGLISVDEISKKIGIPPSKVEEWGMMLEKHDLIDVVYPPVGRPVFKKKAKR